MKKPLINFKLFYFLVLSILLSCSSNPVDKIQGVYVVDKESLKELLQEEIEGESTFAMNLLNVAIENAVVEFEIKGDSINGLMFLAGESTLINSKILIRNDSLVINVGDSEAYLFPTELGLTYQLSGADMSIKLLESEKTSLSEETINAMERQKIAEKDKREFEQNLGIWQKGNYVDEFGDETGDGYAFAIIRGSHDNSYSTNSEVFVKATVEKGTLFFQIYNSSLTMKESFPDSEFGRIKIKYPDGEIDSERIFFYNNSASESPIDKNNLIYNHLLNDNAELKLLIDLSTASDYYSDRYKFTIQKNNLTEILSAI